MFAINHAATALLIKRRFPLVRMVWLLVAVQFMEFIWVILNLAGVESTKTETSVHSVADIHLSYMPYSHSVASILLIAFASWLVFAVWMRRPRLGLAIGIGIASHLVLDLITHAHDLALAPGLQTPKLGLGLYANLPIAAFILELSYGTFCWWVYKGGKALLAVILLFNAANLSFLSPAVSGLESGLAQRPTVIVLLILSEIIVTLFLVGWLSRHPLPAGIRSETEV